MHITNAEALRTHYRAKRDGHTTRKGVRLMRITLHIGAFTVTIIVKSRNRHSAK